MLQVATHIMKKTQNSQWQGVAAPAPEEGKIILNVGTLDGIKEGDKLTVGSDEEEDFEEELIIEEVTDKYATARTTSNKKIEKKMKLKKI